MTQNAADRLNTPRAWAVDLAACALTRAVLGAVGPFGSFFNDGLAVRIGYWTAVLVISGAVFGAAIRWAWPRMRRRRVSMRFWLPMLIVVASGPTAVISRIIAVVLWPGIRQRVGWVEWYGQALLIGAVYVALYALLRMRTSATATRSDEGDPGFARTLPAGLGRDLICLQMEDHYVRVHTTRGSQLVLMSLSQAVSALKGVEGLQTHRSWWVARAAIVGVVEDGRNLRLALTGGLTAPVSRARVANLRAAGWL